MADEADEFLRALRPVVEALGPTVVPARSARRGDVPVRWRGATVTFVRAPELHGALRRLVSDVEREQGAELAELSRPAKQAAVRRLDERGAFLLRGAVDEVARLMGVSRVTLYTYLNANRPDTDTDTNTDDPTAADPSAPDTAAADDS